MSQSLRDENRALRSRAQRCESAARIAHAKMDVLRRQLVDITSIPLPEFQALAETIAEVRLILSGHGQSSGED